MAINWDRFQGEPVDPFSEYCELVIDKLSEPFFIKHEEFVLEGGGTFDEKTLALMDKGKEPEEAAAILERIYKNIKLNKSVLLEEDADCPEDYCNGKLTVGGPDDGGCSCPTGNPPCSWCTTSVYTCSECDFEEIETC